MRVDVVSIFPDYLAPLSLSLPGKAQQSGLLDLHVHDLRQWTHDRHRTVDDAPYGGGAGMVMRPEPWGEALDAVATDGAVLVVPTPSGRTFTQGVAQELSGHPHLVFACGRYEGIDQRVIDDAATRLEVRELSVGDYVLNGGEAATLVVLEAVVRLLPGFLGNPGSLEEESHGGEGLLEYPVYTRPPRWRGRAVPDVLLSGDHAEVARWRSEQSRRRTAERRPDLVPPWSVPGMDAEVRPAVPADAGEVLVLQRACAVQEAVAGGTLALPTLRESYDDVRRWLRGWTVLVMRTGNRLVAAARGRMVGQEWEVGRLMVAPDLQGRGLGRHLLDRIEAAAPTHATAYRLVAASGDGDLRLYRRAGYRQRRRPEEDPAAVVLTRPRTAAPEA